MAAAEAKPADAPVIHTYPLCKTSDMSEEMKQETMEICVTAAEKFADNFEQAARMIKEGLDKKFSRPFQVVVGEAYSFDITYQEKSLIFMYTGGNIACLIWKTVASY